MEKIKIVGKRIVKFKDDSGRDVSGTSFYYLMDDDRIEGQLADKVFVSDNRLFNCRYVPKVGDTVYVTYDRYGKPFDFTLAE